MLYTGKISYFKKVFLHIVFFISTFQSFLCSQNSPFAHKTHRVSGQRRRINEVCEEELIESVQLSGHVYYWDKFSSAYNVLHAEWEKFYGIFYTITCSDKKNIYVTIRGTDNLRNVITDCWFNLAFNQRVKSFYHNGFMKAFEAIENSLNNKLSQIASDFNMSFEDLLRERVILTGHSMGGAIALIAADIYSKLYNACAKTVVFAAPHCMSVKTAHDLNQRMGTSILNIQKDYDPVVKLLSIFQIFNHPGSILRISHTRKIRKPKDIHCVFNYKNSLEDTLQEENPLLKTELLAAHKRLYVLSAWESLHQNIMYFFRNFFIDIVDVFILMCFMQSIFDDLSFYGDYKKNILNAS